MGTTYIEHVSRLKYRTRQQFISTLKINLKSKIYVKISQFARIRSGKHQFKKKRKKNRRSYYAMYEAELCTTGLLYINKKTGCT